MPYRWTKNSIQSDTIVQSREFDNALGNYVDVLNGGLDRDNVPENTVPITIVPSSTFSQIKIFNNINGSNSLVGRDQQYLTATYNPLDRKIYGYRYGEDPVQGGGGWIDATTQSLTTEEGMLEIKWSCSEMKTTYNSYVQTTDAGGPLDGLRTGLRWGQWRILVDSNPVYYSMHQYEIMLTSVHRVNLPISKGSHTIQVQWTVSVQEDGDRDQDQVLFNFWGGQMVCINRYR